VDYFELRPNPVEIVLNGEVFELSPFSLSEMVYFGSTYGHGNVELGIKYLHSVLSKPEVPADLICSITHHMLVDPDTYPSICMFKVGVKGTSDKPKPIEEVTKTISHFYHAIKKNIENSQPIIDDSKSTEDNESKTGKTGQSENLVINWASIYVEIASVIKYTIEEFYKMTLRQIYGIRDQVKVHKYNDLLLQGRLAGAIPKKPNYHIGNRRNNIDDLESAFNEQDDTEMTNLMNEFIKSKPDGRRK